MRESRIRPWLTPVVVTFVLVGLGASARAIAAPAASPAASLSIVKRTATATAPVRDVGSVVAKCKSGEKVTGGGYELQSINTNVQVLTNGPLHLPSGRWGWAITLLNDTDASFDFTAFAMCAKFTP